MVRRFVDPVLGQLRHPHGVLAPVTAQVLNLVNRPINRWAVGALALDGTEQVLDVGFGGGVGLGLVLARITTGRVAGVDVSEEMVRGAARRFADDMQSGRLILARASVDAIPFADRSFDGIYTVNTVFFWPDVAAGLSEIGRVLRPRGRLVIAAPPAGFLLARTVGLARGSEARGPSDVRRLLRQGDFADVRVESRAGASLVVAER